MKEDITNKIKEFLINSGDTARNAIKKLNRIGQISSVLFIIHENKILGSLTDGDIRRGLILDLDIDEDVDYFMNKKFHYLIENQFNKNELNDLKKLNIRFAPILDNLGELRDILDIPKYNSILPLHAVLMAGGRGERLRPLTDQTPKPMLQIGDKPIIEHNIDRLISFGIKNITISIRYLGSQIKDYFGDGSSKGIKINYIEEKEPLGTMGSLGYLDLVELNHILLMNSDLLTDIDYDDLYESYLLQQSDLVVASIPYKVSVPFAVFKLNKTRIVDLQEKPIYTYYSNAGIYIFKKEYLRYIKTGEYYDATDFIQELINMNKNINTYPISTYWLDIGRPEDLLKAKEDFKKVFI